MVISGRKLRKKEATFTERRKKFQGGGEGECFGSWAGQTMLERT